MSGRDIGPSPAQGVVCFVCLSKERVAIGPKPSPCNAPAADGPPLLLLLVLVLGAWRGTVLRSTVVLAVLNHRGLVVVLPRCHGYYFHCELLTYSIR